MPGSAKPPASRKTKMTPELKSKIDEIVQNNDVVLFMKGTKKFPMCGFSQGACQILFDLGCKDFKDVNILQEEDLRSGMKEYSDWPTFPQLYIKGEFQGGFDIMAQMAENGDLKEALANL